MSEVKLTKKGRGAESVTILEAVEDDKAQGIHGNLISSPRRGIFSTSHRGSFMQSSLSGLLPREDTRLYDILKFKFHGRSGLLVLQESKLTFDNFNYCKDWEHNKDKYKQQVRTRLTELGIPEEDATDFSLFGCHRLTTSNFTTRPFSGCNRSRICWNSEAIDQFNAYNQS